MVARRMGPLEALASPKMVLNFPKACYVGNTRSRHLMDKPAGGQSKARTAMDR